MYGNLLIFKYFFVFLIVLLYRQSMRKILKKAGVIPLLTQMDYFEACFQLFNNSW